jgi:hypothetical protein
MAPAAVLPTGTAPLPPLLPYDALPPYALAPYTEPLVHVAESYAQVHSGKPCMRRFLVRLLRSTVPHHCMALHISKVSRTPMAP